MATKMNNGGQMSRDDFLKQQRAMFEQHLKDSRESAQYINEVATPGCSTTKVKKEDIE